MFALVLALTLALGVSVDVVGVGVGLVAIGIVACCITTVAVAAATVGIVAADKLVAIILIFLRVTLSSCFAPLDRYGHAALSPEQQSTLTECINNLNRCDRKLHAYFIG